MRIHHLQLRSIGPFAAEQTVDFDTLGRAGMFLLEGPTGVGKSTIIDAIVFALYGDVASDSADKDRLVSHFRELDDEPSVEMVFSTAHGVFRVRRSPAHQRLKARAKHADDVTQQNATATLQRLTAPSDGGGTPIASRPADVGAAVREVVGLDRKQFVSTIVLPQGQFAEFLTASSNERRPLLQRIFRTHDYDQLQQRLRDAGRSAEAARQTAQASVVAALDKLRGAIPGPEAGPLIEVDPDREDLPGLVAATIAQLQAQCAEAAQTLDRADEQRSRCASALADIEQRIQRRDTKVAAEQRAELLRAAQDTVDEHRARLAADERAARLADALGAAERTAAAQSRGRERVDECRAAAPGALGQLTPEALQSHSEELRQTLGALRPLVSVEAGLVEQRQHLSASRAEVSAIREERTALLERSAELPRLISTAQEAVQSATATASGRSAVEAEMAAAERRSAAAEELERDQPLVDESEHTVAGLLRQEQQAAQDFQTLTAAYRAGIAATIAADLRPNEPCPACGSLEHPNPAVPDANHVTAEQVDAAQAFARDARHRLEDANRERTELQRRLAGLAAQADGWSTARAHAEMVRLQERADAVQQAAVAAEAAEQALVALQTEQQQAASRLQVTADRLAEGEAQAAAIGNTVRTAEEQVSARLAGSASIAARITDLEQELAACDELGAAAEAHAQAAGAAQQASQDLAAALTREHFASVQEATQARLAATVRATLQDAVRKHEEESLKVTDILARPELRDVDPIEAIDRTPVAEALAGAEAVRKSAADAAATTAHVLAQAQRLAQELAEAVDDRERVATQTSTSILLARLAEGKNTMGIDLATFVLVQRFRSVVAAANTHLSRMSNGRLVLEAFEDVVKRSARAGLGIQVRDLHTESVRTPQTLSGGEMFYASLSLALGLAEIVTAESGGVELDTLFVDEGFGSLDQDTLDTVMGVLDGLRSNGRVLGLVSHVTEMKERIPERIEVRRLSATGGSGLRIVA